MAELRSSGYSLFFVLIVGILAHSCGVDEGKRTGKRRARNDAEYEISSLKSRHNQEKSELEEQVRRLRANCPAEAR